LKEKMTSSIKIGDTFRSYYGNGQYIGIITVKRVTEKSIFVSGEVNPNHSHREGVNSVNRYINTGLWVIKSA
jgi:hypothetical protein